MTDAQISMVYSKPVALLSQIHVEIVFDPIEQLKAASDICMTRVRDPHPDLRRSCTQIYGPMLWRLPIAEKNPRILSGGIVLIWRNMFSSWNHRSWDHLKSDAGSVRRESEIGSSRVLGKQWMVALTRYQKLFWIPV